MVIQFAANRKRRFDKYHFQPGLSLSDFLKQASSAKADSIRIYFGVYPEKQEENPEYSNRQTVVMVATKLINPKSTHQNHYSRIFSLCMFLINSTMQFHLSLSTNISISRSASMMSRPYFLSPFATDSHLNISACNSISTFPVNPVSSSIGRLSNCM